MAEGDTKICLCIIFNHRYDKNIDILNEIYGDRFEKIYFLVPFYDGDREDVIPVFEASFQFQGYVAQAMTHIKKDDFTDFLFIGDDLILHPDIDQYNIGEFLHNDGRSCISYIAPLYDMWQWNYRYRGYNAYQAFHEYMFSGTEYQGQIISSDEAFAKVDEPREKFVFNLEMLVRSYKREEQLKFIHEFPEHAVALSEGIPMKYPLYGGYSDIFMIRADEIDELAHTFGVFAAMRLFVEIAIPTAMKILCSDLRIIPKNNLAMWTHAEKNTFPQMFDYDLGRLFAEWPDDCIYIHPVKLSEWRY